MDKQFRTFLFVGIMAAIVGFIFYTPFGIVWGIVVFGTLGVLEATMFQIPVNLFLWAFFCYLLTVQVFWIILLKKAPQLQPAKIIR
ncbi:hypothetical protein ACFL2U_00095 [Patescibacteria group bacterium]